jgi:hypothetical protein
VSNSQQLGLLLFPFAVILLMLAGMGVATLVDAFIWVPKRIGIGWTLDWSKPLSWLVLAYTLGIVLLVRYGATHPDALGVSDFIQLGSRLAQAELRAEGLTVRI